MQHKIIRNRQPIIQPSICQNNISRFRIWMNLSGDATLLLLLRMLITIHLYSPPSLLRLHSKCVVFDSVSPLYRHRHTIRPENNQVKSCGKSFLALASIQYRLSTFCHLGKFFESRSLDVLPGNIFDSLSADTGHDLVVYIYKLNTNYFK